MTAWYPSGVRRSRSTAAVWRLLGLGLFLFGLLYSHAVTPDATARHLSAGVGAAVSGDQFAPVAIHTTTVSALPTAVGQLPEAPSQGHHGGHGQHHGGTECALGQPPHAPGPAVPCLSPLGSLSYDDVPPQSAYAGHAGARAFTAPAAHAADSAVLRV
jgi:hypothetical protein